MTSDLRQQQRRSGTVVRVSGPLVEVEGLVGVAMSEMVELGPLRLPGELVALADGVATVQAYDYSGGLAPGHVARPLGEPLSAWLGPGLLGGMFDGLLRPLLGADTWLRPGATAAPDAREWAFEPQVAVGDHLGPGDTVGVVHPDGPLELRVLVPPRGGGRVDEIVGPGPHPADATLAVVGGARRADGSALAGPPAPAAPRPHRER